MHKVKSSYKRGMFEAQSSSCGHCFVYLYSGRTVQSILASLSLLFVLQPCCCPLSACGIVHAAPHTNIISFTSEMSTTWLVNSRRASQAVYTLSTTTITRPIVLHGNPPLIGATASLKVPSSLLGPMEMDNTRAGRPAIKSAECSGYYM